MLTLLTREWLEQSLAVQEDLGSILAGLFSNVSLSSGIRHRMNIPIELFAVSKLIRTK